MFSVSVKAFSDRTLFWTIAQVLGAASWTENLVQKVRFIQQMILDGRREIMFQISSQVKPSFIELLYMLMKLNWWISQRLPHAALLHWRLLFPPRQLFSDSTDWTRSAAGNISTPVSLILGNISSLMSVWFWYSHQKGSEVFHTMHQNQHDHSGGMLCVAQGSTLLDIQWCQCCEDVVRVFAEKRCRLLTDETLNTTWHRAVFPQPATISLPPASRLPPHRRFCAVAMCPRQCAVSGKVKKQKLSVLLPSRCTCQKSGDWHFPVVLPLGGIIQGCAACCATAMKQQLPLEPVAWIYVFQTPSGVRNSAKKSCW